MEYGLLKQSLGKFPKTSSPGQPFMGCILRFIKHDILYSQFGKSVAETL